MNHAVRSGPLQDWNLDSPKILLHLEPSVGLTTVCAGQDLKWFFQVCEDVEKRKNIFSNVSLEKLKELKDGKEWIKWIRGVFKKNEEEMVRLAQQELARKQPATLEEKLTPKYKMRCRVQSQSHKIANDAFDEWNKLVKDTKIYRAEKKDLPVWAKSELIVDITFPKGVSPVGLWNAGFSLAKTFVNAINIGTFGLFWWNMPKDIERYYEEIVDLETDKTGNTKLRVVPHKRLMIDWGDDTRQTLWKENIGEISLVSSFLMMNNEKLADFMVAYAMGMTCLSKTDIHLRLEANAFEEFFKALKSALIKFGDWDGVNDLKETLKKVFPGAKDLNSLIQMGLDLEPKDGRPHNITLTEVVSMKIFCDVYIKFKAREYYDQMSGEELKNGNVSDHTSEDGKSPDKSAN